MSERVVSIVGSPNAGKSSLFNSIGGGGARVANWPGTTTTVMLKELKLGGKKIVLVDTPGAYAIRGHDEMSKVLLDFLLHKRPDMVLVLVDLTNIKRSLNLAVEVLELHSNVAVVLTKGDLAEKKRIKVDLKGLSRSLGVPVIYTSVAKGEGIEEVLKLIESSGAPSAEQSLKIDYGRLEGFVAELEGMMKSIDLPGSARWFAVKLLEGDPIVRQFLIERGGRAAVERAEAMLRELVGVDVSAIVASSRQRLVSQLVAAHITKPDLRIDGGISRTDRLLVASRFAPLASALIYALIFTIIFAINTGFPITTTLEALGHGELAATLEEFTIVGVMERVVEAISETFSSIMGDSPAWMRGLMIDGIVAGLSVVLFFAPLVFLVSIALTALEDLGLSPRLAVGLHAYSCRVGLSGHSIFPITSCFGCNVPAILSIKSVPSPWERIKLYLLVSLLPCQARLVVFLAIASAIEGFLGLVSLILTYAISLVMLSALSLILDRVSGKSTATLLMEVPELHRPMGRVVWWTAASQLREFLYRAGPLIFGAALFSWAVTHVTPDLSYTEEPSESVAARLSQALLSPLLSPMGIEGENSWLVGYSLIAGMLAKEIFLGALVAASASASPVEAISSLGMSEPALVALMVFIALYIPCLSTVASIYGETRSKWITAGAIVISLVSAYVASLAIYLLFSYLIS